MSTCAFVSFRLGLTDGVSIVTGAWRRCFERSGWYTYTVAGEGPVDVTVEGLAIDAPHPPAADAVAAALAAADLVVVENLLSIPLNLGASRAVAAALRGRPAVLHHHDPPWQRARFAHVTELPPDDAAWLHVTINRFTAAEMADRGLAATPIYNGFDPDEPPGDRTGVRTMLGLDPATPLVLHPVRAIARKNVPAAVAVAEMVDGVYWLPGPAEEDYADELERIVAAARCDVVRTTPGELGPGLTMPDLYAAADLVAFPSTWEGFGNPPIEAAIHRRPVVVGHYPASDELRELGFRWLDPGDQAAIRRAVIRPPVADMEHNRRLVADHLSIDGMCRRVNSLLERAGLSP
ncbi:MAG: glycosyltransferase family 4 protein [Acidimicrobiales bacterium]